MKSLIALVLLTGAVCAEPVVLQEQHSMQRLAEIWNTTPTEARYRCQAKFTPDHPLYYTAMWQCFQKETNVFYANVPK